MIHELRGPLSSVIGGIELLHHSKCLSIEDKKNLQISQHCAEVLLNLINNALDMAKLEQGQVELDRQFYKFRALIN